jgi:DNA-binding transcriptional LysR family regulator
MLHIGASAYSSPELLDRLYSTELRTHPNLSIEFITESTTELLKDLQLKKIDLALLLTPPESRSVTTTLVASQPFMIAMRDSHPLASKRSVTLSEVAGYPWILFSRSAHSHLHDLILKRVEETQRRPTIVHRILHADQIPAFLKNDSTLAWLTPAGTERLADRGFVFVPLLDLEIRLEAHLAALADNKSRLVSDFVRTFMKDTEDLRTPAKSPRAA